MNADDRFLDSEATVAADNPSTEDLLTQVASAVLSGADVNAMLMRGVMACAFLAREVADQEGVHYGEIIAVLREMAA